MGGSDGWVTRRKRQIIDDFIAAICSSNGYVLVQHFEEERFFVVRAEEISASEFEHSLKSGSAPAGGPRPGL